VPAHVAVVRWGVEAGAQVSAREEGAEQEQWPVVRLSQEQQVSRGRIPPARMPARRNRKQKIE